jgi:hypothetical protein
MPVDKAKLQKLNDMMDSWLEQRNQEIVAGTYYDDEDDDPVQYLDPPRTLPVAER